MKRLIIELKEFEYNTERRLDRLYDQQDRPFVIRTKDEELATVELKWQQGRGQNYYFEGLAGVFYPSDIEYIEFIPEWGML